MGRVASGAKTRSTTTRGRGGASASARKKYAPSAARVPRTHKPLARPDFTAATVALAELTVNTSFRRFGFNIGRGDNKTLRNLAIPHRVSWKNIRDLTVEFFRDGTLAGTTKFQRWTDAFVRAGDAEITKAQKKYDKHRFGNHKPGRQRTPAEIDALRRKVTLHENSQNDFKKKLQEFTAKKDIPTLANFLKSANNFHANVPDYGPHRGVNVSVKERFHPSFNGSATRPGTPDAMTEQASHILAMLSPVAVNATGQIIQTTGRTIAQSAISARHAPVANNFLVATKGVVRSYDPNFRIYP